MNTWPIAKRVGIACGALVTIAIATGWVGVSNVQRTAASIRFIASSALPGMDQLTSLQALALELRGTSLLMGTPGLSDSYKTPQLRHIAELQQQTMDLLHSYGSSVPSAERPLYEALESRTAALVAGCAHFRELVANGKTEEAGDYWSKQGGKLSKAFRKSMQDEVNFNKAAASRYADAGFAAAQAAYIFTWVLLIFSVVVGAILGTAVVRSVSRALSRSAGELRMGAEQITLASEQLASGSQMLAQGASEQAAVLEETSASGHQISAMTERNAEHSRSAAMLMASMDAKVAEANTRLDQMVVSMEEITSSSERIAKIIKVIDDIAFQTNILALNASVEAARAGEAGMGFAVVADEVRNLAQRSAQAAKDTASLIEESVTNARNGGIRLDEVATVIRGITETSGKVKTLVEEVSVGAGEQSRGIDQISSALVQIEQTTQQTAAASEENAAASQELLSQAASMKAIVRTLEMLASSRERRTQPTYHRDAVALPTTKELLPLQKAVGVSKPIVGVTKPRTTPAPAFKPTPVSSSKTAIPLDDADFREF